MEIRSIPNWLKPLDDLPLILFTVLAPAAVGALATLLPFRAGAEAEFGLFGFTILAMATTFAHLGQPRRFYRAVRNIFRSWLSREAVFFGGFAGLLALRIGLRLTGWFPAVSEALGWAALGAGLLTVLATARVYAIPSRPDWGHWTGQVSFGLTALTLGPVLAALIVIVRPAGSPAWFRPGWLMLWLGFLALGGVMAVRRRICLAAAGSLSETGRLGWYNAGLGFRLIAGVLLPLGLLAYGWYSGQYAVWAIFLAVLAGELAERTLFFGSGEPVSVESEIGRVRREYRKIQEGGGW